MANQNGIAIVIKAWLPVTGSISEQIAKLQMVETAHTSGDYAPLLAVAKVEDVKTEQKTRRIDDEPAAPKDAGDLDEPETADPTTDASGLAAAFDAVEPADDADVPRFLKGKGK